MVAKRLLLVGLLISAPMLSGCIQGQVTVVSPLENISNHTVADRSRKLVDRAFYSVFIGGDWFYKGTKTINGSINAYIQIPQKLDMKPHQQQNYLRQSICPSAQHKEMWDALGEIPLSVHIYTYNKKFTVHAHCDNPYLS